MKEIVGFFDKLHFTESTLWSPSITTTQLRVPITGLMILQGHPMESSGYGPYSGDLVFDDVVSSRRTVIEYIGDPRNPSGFGTPRQVADEFEAKSSMQLQNFTFEGLIRNPDAWVDEWVVLAREFRLLINEDNG
jgi:hypothetical protein